MAELLLHLPALPVVEGLADGGVLGVALLHRDFLARVLVDGLLHIPALSLGRRGAVLIILSVTVLVVMYLMRFLHRGVGCFHINLVVGSIFIICKRFVG